jgi:hypothetical protein
MPESKLPDPDPAAEAFEALRGEVALLRRAVMGLSAERASFPDYSDTLAEITRMVSSIGRRLVALSELPAFALTPDAFGREITEASRKAREEDRGIIVASRDTFDRVASEFRGRLQSAREADQQKNWLIVSASAGALLGMIAWAWVFAPIVHWFVSR